MIVYSGSIKEFNDSVISGQIADKIEKEFRTKKIQSNFADALTIRIQVLYIP